MQFLNLTVNALDFFGSKFYLKLTKKWIVLLIVYQVFTIIFVSNTSYPRYQQDIRLNNLLIFNEETFIYISLRKCM